MGIVSGAIDPPSPPASSTNIANQNVYSNTNNNDLKKTKRRIRRSRNTRWTKRLGRILADEDSLVTIIQITSTIIITGCLITLILHFFGTGEEGESGWKNSLLVKTNWMFRPKTMHKKRKDIEYKRVRDGNGLYTRVDMEPSDVYTIPDSLPFLSLIPR